MYSLTGLQVRSPLSRCWQDHAPFKGSRKGPCLPLPNFWGLPTILVFLGLQLLHSNLCLHFHMASLPVSWGILSSTYKDTSHWIKESSYSNTTSSLIAFTKILLGLRRTSEPSHKFTTSNTSWSSNTALRKNTRDRDMVMGIRVSDRTEIQEPPHIRWSSKKCWVAVGPPEP